MLNIDTLLVPLAGDNPQGESLEYDPRYEEMEALAVAVADKQIGDSVIGGHGPDWKKLEKTCVELWAKTRDLRVASYLTVALACENGFAGLSGGFRLLKYLVSELWTQFYPLLDAEDDNDPLERLNILIMLSPELGAVNDPVMFISHLRLCRLVPSLTYTTRDLMLAQGDLDAGGDTGAGKELNLINAEIFNLQKDEVETALNDATAASTAIKDFCAAMTEKMGSGFSVTMTALEKEIEYVSRYLSGILSKMRASAEADADADASDDMSTSDGTPATLDTATIKGASGSGKLKNRAEAVMFLRKGAEYFEREEPSSPVPLLIKRAIRFSEMSFMDLLADIAPDALPRGNDILGVKPANEE
jgi:type VI secretion system protein ImpA